MKPIGLYCLMSFYLIINTFIKGQSDTLPSKETTHQKHKRSLFQFSQWSSPKKASVLSAILPGAGQIYNKKYWKAPVIYTLGGLLTYNFIQQNNYYLYYKKELLNVMNGGTNPDGYSAQQLILLKNQNKKWRDLSAVGVFLVYVLNILDANVDAHLKQFDVSDNLSVLFHSNIHITACSIVFRF